MSISLFAPEKCASKLVVPAAAPSESFQLLAASFQDQSPLLTSHRESIRMVATVPGSLALSSEYKHSCSRFIDFPLNFNAFNNCFEFPSRISIWQAASAAHAYSNEGVRKARGRMYWEYGLEYAPISTQSRGET